MSHNLYNNVWKETQDKLKELLIQEPNSEKQKPEKDRNAAFQLIATLYVKYIQIFKNFDKCYDQIVHPQKRILLRRLLDSVMGRILEIKKEMVDLELSEFHYFDDILVDLKLTPNDVEIPIPKYFKFENFRELHEREEFLNQLLFNIDVQSQQNAAPSMTVDQAILLIQRHERARQGRLRAKFMKEIIQQDLAGKNSKCKKQESDPNSAALLIQKMWRGTLARKYVKTIRNEELIWLGMTPVDPNTLITKSNMVKLADRVDEVRRIAQNINEQEYQNALDTMKDKIKDLEGSDMRQNMQDQIRQWFIECRDATGKFPDYPDEDEGGSALLFMEKTPEELEAEMKAKEENQGNKKKSTKSSGKKKSAKPDDKKKKKNEEVEGWQIGPSVFLNTIQDDCYNYETMWLNRIETDNFAQHHDEELIKETKRVEVENDIRMQVDELLRQELRNLRIAIDKEKVKKSKKKGKKKRGKSKKGRKGRREKDLTPDRTLVSLYEELVMNGIIKKVPHCPIGEYYGEYSYLGTTLRQSNIEPQPSISDIRRLITEYGILPLGSQSVHENAPWIKSILLTGPKGTGKRTLVNTICTETGANLFDLSAENLVDKYPGTKGLQMLMHMVFKLARQLQPSVILINDCEKMFKRKLAKTDLPESKRLKRDLPKSMKLLKAEDRVLLVGCSSVPFDAEIRAFCKLYQKIILLPRPDYSSRHLIWRTQILKHNGLLTDALDVSSLTKISDGYTPGHISKICEEVLTEKRVAQLNRIPLKASEFVAPMAQIEPIFADEEEAFKSWYRKTPLGKKRAQAIQDEMESAKDSKKGKTKSSKKK